MVRIENKKKLLHADLSESIIGSCFEVIKELGSGFLENVYKNALFIALPIGLLVNFGNQKIEYKRLHHPDIFFESEDFPEDTLHSLSLS